MWKSVAAALGVVVVSVFGVLSCEHRDEDEFFDREVTRLQEATLPDRASIVSESSTRREQFSKGRTWEFETEQTWADYTRWVTQRLVPEFRAAGGLPEGASIVFAKDLPGDMLTVEVVLLADAPRRHVRVVFRGMAN